MSPILISLLFAAAACTGAASAVIVSRRAIGAQRERLEELLGEARTDALTGVANRRAWEEELPRELARARRNARPVSIVLADLDGLKRINDSQGHQAGDRLLQAAATRFRDCLREIDVVARFGGDEFGFALPDCPEGAALQVAERLRLAAPAGVTCSLGVAGWDGSESAQGLFARADRALYEAKRCGRNRVLAALPPHPPEPLPVIRAARLSGQGVPA